MDAPALDPNELLRNLGLTDTHLELIGDDALDVVDSYLAEHFPDHQLITRLPILAAAYVVEECWNAEHDLFAYIASKLRADKNHGRKSRNAATEEMYLKMLLISALCRYAPTISGIVEAAGELRQTSSYQIEQMGLPRYSDINTRRRTRRTTSGPAESKDAFNKRKKRLVTPTRHHFQVVHNRVQQRWEEPLPWAEIDQLGLHIPDHIRAAGPMTLALLLGLTFMQSTFAVDDREHRTNAIAFDETKIEAFPGQNLKGKPYGCPDGNSQHRTTTDTDPREWYWGYAAQGAAYTHHVDKKFTDPATQKPLVLGIFLLTGRNDGLAPDSIRMTGLLDAYHRLRGLDPLRRVIADRGYTKAAPENFARPLHLSGIDVVQYNNTWLDGEIGIGETGFAFHFGRLYHRHMLDQLHELDLHDIESPVTGRTTVMEILERRRVAEINKLLEPGSDEHTAALEALETELDQAEHALAETNRAHREAAAYAFRFREYRYDSNGLVTGIVYQGPAAGATRTATCTNWPHPNTRPLKHGKLLPHTTCAPIRKCPHRNREQCIANGGCYHQPDPNEPVLGPATTEDCEHQHGHCDHGAQCWRDHGCLCGSTIYLPLINPIEQLNAGLNKNQRAAARTLTTIYDKTTDTYTIEQTDPDTGKPFKVETHSPKIERLLGRLTYGSAEWSHQIRLRNRIEAEFALLKGAMDHTLKKAAIKQRGQGAFGILALASLAAKQILILLNRRHKDGLNRWHWPNFRARVLIAQHRGTGTLIHDALADYHITSHAETCGDDTERAHRDTGPPDPGNPTTTTTE